MQFKVKIDSAVEVAEKNLKEHIAELKEATNEWTKELITAIEKFRDAVTRKGLEASHQELYALMYQRPKDNRKNYSKFIGAMKRAQTDGQATVEVNEDDFDRIFNDNWKWRVESKASNARYTKRS